VPQFAIVTVIPAPCERVFGLSLDVGVHAASMAASGERPVAGVTTGQMRLGDRVTWRARHFGLPWELTSEITTYDRPHLFIDEQISGPFAHWHHAHHFDIAPDDRTIMRDIVDFAAPFGLVGRLVDALLVERYMIRLIRARNQHLVAVAERGSNG
jgi:ligand-binding SRPBCC domain-containing protein